jgi:hypothetical protein
MDEAVAFADHLAELRHQHLENLHVHAHWAGALATLNLWRASGDRAYGMRLCRESQHAYEACGQPGLASIAASGIPLGAIVWDATDDPDVAEAIKDSILLAEASGFPNMVLAVRVLEGVIKVMGGARDAYPSCLAALAELDDLDGGITAQLLGGLHVNVAAELVGDQSVTTAHTLRLVRFCRRSGVRVMLSFGIRSAARLAATAGHPAEALQLWGGAEQAELVTGVGYMPLMQRLDRLHLQQCVDALGPDAARLLAEGASWSVAEATQAAEEALVRLQADNDWNAPTATAI